jgi:hypothetical protein
MHTIVNSQLSAQLEDTIVYKICIRQSIGVEKFCNFLGGDGICLCFLWRKCFFIGFYMGYDIWEGFCIALIHPSEKHPQFTLHDFRGRKFLWCNRPYQYPQVLLY